MIPDPVMDIQSLSAVTLVVSDMSASVAFYDALGFRVVHGGGAALFSSYEIGGTFLNLQQDEPGDVGSWGRIIVHVRDVDAMWQRVVRAGGRPDGEPADASWGERYFHVRDPDGHELSFARPLAVEGSPQLTV